MNTQLKKKENNNKYKHAAPKPMSPVHVYMCIDIANEHARPSNIRSFIQALPHPFTHSFICLYIHSIVLCTCTF